MERTRETGDQERERLSKQEFVDWWEHLKIINDDICKIGDGVVSIIFFITIPAVCFNTYNFFHYLTIFIYITLYGIKFNQKKVIVWNYAAIDLIDFIMRGFVYGFFIQLVGLIVFFMYLIYIYILSNFGLGIEFVRYLFNTS